MLDFIKQKSDCTGCTACYNACPVRCIEMKADEEGFIYPEARIDECIHCGKCEKVCPLASRKTQREIDIKQKVLTARSKNIDTWFKSASGGAFSEICQCFENNDIVIYGAVMKHGYVRHEVAFNIGDIGKFRKSKYVQSNLGDSFLEIKKHLEDGKNVVFSGTPCQIAGLRSYLRKDFDNLFLIDFICHGVGSPSVLMKCMNYVGEKYNFECIDYHFRQKLNINGRKSFYISFYSKGDKKDFLKFGPKEDPYLGFFLSQLCLRPCCQKNCKFRNPNRLSDITIADYKSTVRRHIIPIYDDKNYSSIIFNTRKGLVFYEKLVSRMVSYPSSLEELSKINPLFFRTTKDNPLRDTFFKDYVNGVTIEELYKKYCKTHQEKEPNMVIGVLRRLKGMVNHYINSFLDLVNIY